MQRTRCYYFYDGAARCNKREPGSGCDALDGFNLAEYHVPVQADIPFIDIVYTDVPDPHTPLGAHHSYTSSDRATRPTRRVRHSGAVPTT
jgi:hypothetical protein